MTMKKILILSFLFNWFNFFGQEIIIKNANIISVNEGKISKNQSILISDGKILQIGNFKHLFQKKPKSRIINAEGKYIMPGLADMHVHLTEKGKIDNQLLNFIAAGVTHIRVMNSDSDQLEISQKKKNRIYNFAPNIFFSKVIKRGETYNKSQADSLMNDIKNNGLSFIKLFGLSNEDTFNNIMSAAQKNNVIVCGHYPVYVKEGKGKIISLDTVLKKQFKSIEHLAGYLYYPEDQLDRLIKLTKENNIFNCPTLDWDIISNDLYYPTKYKDRITYKLLPKRIIENWEIQYSLAIEKAGGVEKVIENRDKYSATFTKKTNLLKKLYDSNCLLLLGGDSGNTFQADGFNLYEEMVNWSNVGIDNYTILKSATYNAAKFFNQENKWGSVKENYDADLILLDKNPVDDIKNITSIRYTIFGGKVIANQDLINKIN